MATIVAPPCLTLIESNRLGECEAVVRHGIETFVSVGNALAEIRDSRLYRATHKTFTDYCAERWGMTDRRARQLISGADIADEIGTTVPLSERAVRPLTSLPDEQRPAATAEVRERVEAGERPAAAIADVVAKSGTTVPVSKKPAYVEDDDRGTDLVDELESAARRITELEAENASLRADDTGNEIRRLSDLRAKEHANNMALQRKIEALETGIIRRDRVFGRIRKALGITRDDDIVEAIEALLP